MKITDMIQNSFASYVLKNKSKNKILTQKKYDELFCDILVSFGQLGFILNLENHELIDVTKSNRVSSILGEFAFNLIKLSITVGVDDLDNFIQVQKAKGIRGIKVISRGYIFSYIIQQVRTLNDYAVYDLKHQKQNEDKKIDAYTNEQICLVLRECLWYLILLVRHYDLSFYEVLEKYLNVKSVLYAGVSQEQLGRLTK